MQNRQSNKRIGIFSGVFDPVHSGHIDFALEAAKKTGLDEVYFLVEPKPRRKTGVTHLAHRIAMIKLATAPHNNLKVLDLPDKQFSVVKTLPRLKQHFGDAQLVFIAGSDMLKHMHDWPLIAQMLQQMGLIVGMRGHDNITDVQELLTNLPVRPNDLQIMKSPHVSISSGQIRLNIIKNKQAKGLSPKVIEYIKQNWLYSVVSSSNCS